MSSLHKAIHRKTYRERAQPVAREKWGTLEKRKDYSLRAKDYKDKKKRLQILRQKVVQRHPEEFNFGMVRSQPHDTGRRVADPKVVSLSQDKARLLKTQDAGYLNMMAQKTRVARRKLEQEHLMPEATNPRDDGDRGTNGSHHKYFVTSKLEQESPFPTNNRENAPFEPTVKDVFNTPHTQPKDGQSKISQGLKDRNMRSKEEEDLRRFRQKEEKLRESKLKLLRQRQIDIREASEALAQQRVRMANNVGGVTTAGFRWQIRERRR